MLELYICVSNTILMITLSKLNVLVRAKAHPASKPRLIIAELVVGVADASPNGFSK